MSSSFDESPALVVRGLTMRFGGILAIDNLDFGVRTGEVTAMIGPNGAGKTTAFNCVTGFYKPTAGEITVRDGTGVLRVDRLAGHKIVTQAGIARTFQNIRLFAGMTALENLLVAQHQSLSRSGFLQLQGLFGLPMFKAAETAAVEKAMGWLARMGLAARANDEAGTLPYGLQRRLEIARAMCLDPRFLCLDEPAAGLNPRESAALARDLRRLTEEDGIGVLLIEHDMSVVMNVSDRVIVLDYGPQNRRRHGGTGARRPESDRRLSRRDGGGGEGGQAAGCRPPGRKDEGGAPDPGYPQSQGGLWPRRGAARSRHLSRQR